ncbi:Protein NRT1/ PTR FAMILY 8.2 [Dichanthelium oligosanthes]|uniref:Protein NRT1/ PTR FAMILY 8.2 n=1 Tax=Dichanthelium oligosanthes TaxID=888268 RepID=A0A1E5UY93_9POAL|nr:Protein NRT1/ PTR FAMILY 8.2 [Dichanthelium oligosanthes]
MAGGGDGGGEPAAETTLDGTTDHTGKPAVRSKTGTWRACPFILGNECCERLAYYGMSSNLVNYMIDRLNQGNAAAANNVSNWSGTCYVMPLLGAFLADAYLGRYLTIAAFMGLYIVGLTLLTMSAVVPGLRPPDAAGAAPTAGQSAAFYVALYLIAVGTGGIKPCVSSFGADQFDDADPRERQSKSSFFNWFYMSINIGALVASSVLVWVQMNVGWGWGFGIPAAAMAVAVASFLLGSRLYRHQKPGGSPLTRMLQVVVAAWRKRKSVAALPADASLLHEQQSAPAIQGSRKLEHTEQFRWLDRAAVPTEEDAREEETGIVHNPWRLCTVTQVEELKSVLRLLPVWASGIVVSAVYSQMSTMFVLQGNTLDPRMGSGAGAFKIPSASLSIFDTLSVIAWAPAYDRLIVPAARRWTGHPRGFTQLQRMGIGLGVSVLSMLAAGALEVARLRVAASHGMLDSTGYLPISIFWQVPQYFIIGAAEVFTFIGQIEFFYDQAPDAMRSMGTALSLTSSALGSYLSALLVSIVTAVTTRKGGLGWIPDNLNRGHLDYFFWLLSVLSVINLIVYLWIAKWYKYKQAAAAAI